MTNKAIKHRRWLHQTKRKILKIERTKIKHHPFLVIPPLNYFSFFERLKSLLNFNRSELPKTVRYKNRIFNLSNQ